VVYFRYMVMLPFILLNVLFKNTINCLDYIVSVIDE